MYLSGSRDNLEKDSAWCTVLLKGITFEAKLAHVGRGKFRILEDNNDGRYTNTIVDASDVFRCKQ